MTSFVRSTGAVGSIFSALSKRVRSAGNQAYPGGRPIKSIIFVMFFFGAKLFTFILF